MARVAVAYNDDVDLKPHLNEIERLGDAEVADAAREAAEVLGAELVPVRGIEEALRTLRAFDAVVDFCEGVLGKPRFEKNFALALEMLGIAHTSCDPIAVALCSDKIAVKRLLQAGAIPTPRAFASPRDTPPGTCIVKPAWQDAGIGIERAAVVSTRAALERRCALIEERFHEPALIEEYISGREFNQSVFCRRLLPPGEIVFAGELRPEERVVGWREKWDAGSAEDRATVNRTPADIDERTRAEIARICLGTCDLLGLDMAVRFDLRQSSQSGVIYIVDINPNPDLGSGSGFRKALDAGGMLFSDLLNTLIIAGCERRSR